MPPPIDYETDYDYEITRSLFDHAVINLSMLFTPIQLGSLKLNNRLAMAPMTRQMAPNNVVSAQSLAYYTRRAENNVGLIITEGTCIGHDGANGYHNVPYFYGEEQLVGWQKVVDSVHAVGGKIVPQLWHVGGIRKQGKHGPTLDAPSYTPSGIVAPGKNRGAPMTQQDIDAVIAAYADAAEHAETIGFDGIEIHGAHGYLIDQFFWAGTNLRSDKFGGSLAARAQFAVEIVKAIRAVVSADFPIIFRFSQWKMQDYEARLAETPQALEQFLAPITAAGVDILHCSTRRYWETEFDESPLNLAGWTKKITGLPTITVGSVGLTTGFVNDNGRGFTDRSDIDTAQFADLDRRLEAGEFDLVAVGRALLQDPEWATKVREQRYAELADYSNESLKTLY